VLLYESEHYKRHLERFDWTFFTDCTQDSLLASLASIGDKYEQASKAARADFSTSLHYEAVFKPIFKKVSAPISAQNFNI
jgi:hypothetical protein